MAVNSAVKYAEMTDEQIDAIKRKIEVFAKENEFFDKFVNHCKWDRGSKTMKSRRSVRPVVKEADVVKSAELVAPRPSKFAVETFSHSVDIYRDKVGYSAEDVLYGYDDIVKLAGDALGEIFTQKLDFIKGKPFFNSACSITYDTSLLKTLAKGAIVLQKNKAKPWSGGRYLAMLTPEALEKIREELEAKGTSISEPTKVDIDSGIIGHYGRWDFCVSTHEYFTKNATTQYMILLGRRPNGESPIDVASIDGVEVIHNPLGSGVLEDVDGNYTSDDNKQKGSIAMNANGLGAYVNDDLCVLKCEISINEIAKSDLDEESKTGFVSISPIALVSVVAKLSGSVVASPTLTFKKGSSSGASVLQTELKVGTKYYMLVSDGATPTAHTAEVTFRAEAANYFVLDLA